MQSLQNIYMKRVITIAAVLLLVLLAGCVGEAQPDAVGPDNVEPAPGGLLSDPPPQNPWKSSNISVSITQSSNPNRDYAPLVRQSLRYWNQNMSTLGWEGRFVYDSNTSNPDVAVHIVDEIPQCGDNRDDKLGCAPLNTRVGSGIDRGPVEIVGRLNDTSTTRVGVHEFGHTLGLTHNDTGNWSIMNETIAAATVPQPNATERSNPFDDEMLYIYYNENGTDALNEYVEGELEEVWGYFNDGESDIVPGTVTFERTNNASRADIELTFVERIDGGVSTVEWYGYDPDADRALETYDTATITVQSDVNQDNVAWHVGGWVTYLFSSQEEGALPDELTTRDPETRRLWPS